MFENHFYFDVMIIKGIINKGVWIEKRCLRTKTLCEGKGVWGI